MFSREDVASPGCYDHVVSNIVLVENIGDRRYFFRDVLDVFVAEFEDKRGKRVFSISFEDGEEQLDRAHARSSCSSPSSKLLKMSYF